MISQRVRAALFKINTPLLDPTIEFNLQHALAKVVEAADMHIKYKQDQNGFGMASSFHEMKEALSELERALKECGC